MDAAFDVSAVFSIVFISFIGLCLGSFATALIYRIPRNLPWIYESGNKASRSQCPQCGAKLGAFDLVPLFSWLFSGGKCRHCGGEIPLFYPATELAVLLLVLVLYGAWGSVAPAFPLFLAVPFLIAASVIDWQTMVLPDSLNLSLTVLSILYVGIVWRESGWSGWVLFDHVLSGVLLPLIFWGVSLLLTKIRGRDALGMGDLKFLLPAGLFLGMAAVPSFMALGGVLGLVTAFLKRIRTGGGAFPFGPALIISLYIHLFLTGLGFDYKW